MALELRLCTSRESLAEPSKLEKRMGKSLKSMLNVRLRLHASTPNWQLEARNIVITPNQHHDDRAAAGDGRDTVNIKIINDAVGMGVNSTGTNNLIRMRQQKADGCLKTADRDDLCPIGLSSWRFARCDDELRMISFLLPV